MVRLLDDERRLDLVLNQESLSCVVVCFSGWLLLLQLPAVCAIAARYSVRYVASLTSVFVPFKPKRIALVEQGIQGIDALYFHLSSAFNHRQNNDETNERFQNRPGNE